MTHRHELIRFGCCLVALAAILALTPPPAAAQAPYAVDTSQTETDASGDLSIYFSVVLEGWYGPEYYDLGSGWVPGTRIAEYNDCNCNDIPAYSISGYYQMYSSYGEDYVDIQYETFTAQPNPSQCQNQNCNCSSPTQETIYYEYYDSYYFDVFY